jgi:hypothetical protein
MINDLGRVCGKLYQDQEKKIKLKPLPAMPTGNRGQVARKIAALPYLHRRGWRLDVSGLNGRR